jgi:hypothetical protein
VYIPLQEREALIEKYRRKNGGKDEPDPVYAAMVESVDTALGNLRATLHGLSVADNTAIILTSDNGGVGFQGRSVHRIADNGPLRSGIEFFEDGHGELYSLALDPGEQYNFASSFADKATDLLGKLRTWRGSPNASMPMLNPEYNAARAGLRVGPAGGSWNPAPGCRED